MTSKVEMNVFHTIPDDKIPYLYRSSKSNRPENASPDRQILINTDGDDSVFSIKIDTTLVNSEAFVKKILDRWDNEEEVVLEFPNISGETKWARVVGVDTHKHDENHPWQRFVRVFIELDEELFLGTFKELPGE